MHPATVQRVPLGRPEWLAAAALAGIAFAALSPALGCDFVNFDDPDYVTRNVYVTRGLSPEGARWAFTTFSVSNWHPLTWLSLQLDATHWAGADGKPEPWRFHLTNVLLHAANAALLSLALRSLTGAYWRSAAVALLFAVHPLRAESVAWVSERKDVLSASFGLLALWAYAGYASAPSIPRYVAVLSLFGLSLLAKPMLVTLPCLLLVLDWWPLGRARALKDWGQLAAEKLPLVAAAAGFCVVTYLAQSQDGAVGGLQRFPLWARAGNAIVSYVVYVSLTVWPVGLAPYYPHPGVGLPAWQPVGAALLLVAVTAVAVALRGRAPYLLAGWLWYVGTLVPVIGLVQVGVQAYADRYTYFPQIGLLLMACWGVADLFAARPRAALAAGAVAAPALAVLAWSQAGVWHDSITLWKHALMVTGSNPVAQNNLGSALGDKGRYAEAVPCYREAVGFLPGSAQARLNLADALQKSGDLEGAARQFREACKLAYGRDAALPHTYLGGVLYDLGRFGEAAREQEEAIRLDPGMTAAYYKLALAEQALHVLPRAVGHFEEAVRREPGWAEARCGLGLALLELKKDEEGLAQLREAVRRDARHWQAHLCLGTTLAERGDADGAATYLDQAVRLNPDPAPAWYYLGVARLRQGRAAEAVECLGQAVKRNPGSSRFRAALDAAKQALNQRTATAPPPR
jgi:tetratricopeptide (TPR) repeat protein